MKKIKEPKEWLPNQISRIRPEPSWKLEVMQCEKADRCSDCEKFKSFEHELTKKFS